MIIVSDRYVIKQHTVNELKKLGFRYLTTDDGEELYILRFPIHKHNECTTVECFMVVAPLCKKIVMNVTDINQCIYPPFYFKDKRSQYSKELLDGMEQNMRKMFRKVGVKRWK